MLLAITIPINMADTGMVPRFNPSTIISVITAAIITGLERADTGVVDADRQDSGDFPGGQGKFKGSAFTHFRIHLLDQVC